MKFSVHEVNQAAGGGSYVCIFDAEIALDPSGAIFVSVESVEPPETGGEYVTAASEAIRAGAVHALGPHGLGAAIHVTRLLVNFVDFKPSRYSLYTARELIRLLEGKA